MSCLLADAISICIVSFYSHAPPLFASLFCRLHTPAEGEEEMACVCSVSAFACCTTLNIAVMLWILMNWYTDIGPGVESIPQLNRRLELVDIYAAADVFDDREEQPVQPENPYLQQRPRNTQANNEELLRLIPSANINMQTIEGD